MTKICTERVPMPSKPESRRKENGYIVRESMENIENIIGFIRTNIEQLAVAESASQKLPIVLGTHRNLRDLAMELAELKKSLKIQ